MTLIVGLGNPGTQYAHTRHNVGFMVIDAFLETLGVHARQENRFKAIVAEGRIGQKRVILAKPTTFMNLSGEAVSALMHWYKLTPADLIILYDDFAIPLGTVRVRPDGSAGGHNGIRSIIQHIGTSVFPRVRVGIGPLPPQFKSPDFVLGRFAGSEQTALKQGLALAVDASECLLAHGIEQTMQRFNTRQEAKPTSGS